MTSTVIKVPKAHALDWATRNDLQALIVGQTERTITLRLAPGDLSDLIADAEYYAAEMGRDNTGDVDYRPNARTLLRNLKKQGYDWKMERGTFVTNLKHPSPKTDEPKKGMPASIAGPLNRALGRN